MPVMSDSWNASVPMTAWATCAVNTTIGIESMYALAMPVTVLVAPGPLVTSATPTFPLALAYPSAACTPPCSCLGKIVWICFESNRASKIGSATPPG